MVVHAFDLPAEPLGHARRGAILRFLEAAIDAVLNEIAATELGCLVSLLIEVPARALPEAAVQGSDVFWRAPSQDLVMYGRGQAIRFGSNAARNFESACASWRLLSFSSKSMGIPRTFFSVPSAPAPAMPTLWVPQVLLQHFEGNLTITLTARRDSNPLSWIARRWVAEVEALLAPPRYEVTAGQNILSMRAAPDDREWMGRAEAAIKAIASGHFHKVVLGRRLELRLAFPPEVTRLTWRLAKDHPACCIFALPHGNGRTIAASPEMLAIKRGRTIVCDALAGTAKRTGVANQDAKAGLMSSVKERHEHALVVDDIRTSLAPICENVAHASEPSVLQLKSLLHLQTRIHGRLRPGSGLLDAVARIHPTAAVLGYPRPAAAAWLKDVGENRDGLYSGAAGWLDLNGDGEAAVVLRSAYIEGRTAALWAGAGIVAQSEPAAELAETSLKFATMLEALGAA